MNNIVNQLYKYQRDKQNVENSLRNGSSLRLLQWLATDFVAQVNKDNVLELVIGYAFSCHKNS